MNRGSFRRVDCLVVDVLVASMRPRFMNRGSSLTRVGILMPSRCFNEAPIHESGKLRRIHAAAPAEAGFNEAPIHESGK